ncbi:MAG TPA: glycosyl hydrolase family 28 protein [Syntrophorhabdaceae bacterium]
MKTPRPSLAGKQLARGLVIAILGLLPLFLLFPLLLQAEITVYPAPQDAPGNPTFTVEVRSPGGAWSGLFVYDAMVDKTTQSHMSFAYFDSDFSTNVEVRVTNNSGVVSSAVIRPDSAGLVPSIAGNTVTFTMTAPKKISVEIDHDIYHNLFIFANGKDLNPIASSGPKVLYYGPGTHLIGDGTGTLYPSIGDTVYIAGGAIVYGKILVHKAHDVTIAGRGILSGGKFDHAIPDNTPKPPMLTVNESTGITVQDIIIIDGVGWNIPIIASDAVVVDNVKIMGWMVNSDGILPQYSRNVTINDCFIRTNDDCITIKLALGGEGGNTMGSYNTAIQNSVLWADQGRAVLIGPESYSISDRTFDGIKVRNIDILEVDNYDFDWARGVLAINSADGVTVRNVAFQNIRVDHISAMTNLLNLTMAPTPYNTSPGGSVQNITFDNVILKGANQKANGIFGYDADRVVDGVSVKNLKINNACVQNAAAGDIQVNSYTRNISFFCGPEADIEPPAVPVNLRAKVPSPSTVIFTWTASADNVAVEGYKVYRNGSLAGTSTGTSYSTVPPSTDSNYTVSAYDAANNESAQSTAVLVLTPPVGFDQASLSRTSVIKKPRVRRHRLTDGLSLSY